MLELFFLSDKEAISFCELLIRNYKKTEFHWKTDERWGSRLQFSEEDATEELQDAIAWTMADVFMLHRLKHAIIRTIREDYHFSEKEEIERIHDYAEWILTGEEKESRRLRNQVELREFLKGMFAVSLKDVQAFHFDSIVNFRLKTFKRELVEWVGLAIDEFKREEDHQTFIDGLRAYILKKKPSIPVVHILQGSSFSFYQEDGSRMKRVDLRALLEREPLYIVGLHDNEFNLAPLVAMAPERLHIYGDDPSEPKTLTVINVFQEKVDFLPANKFPFIENGHN